MIIVEGEIIWEWFVFILEPGAIFFLNENFLPVLFCIFHVFELEQFREGFKLLFIELLLVRWNVFFFFPFWELSQVVNEWKLLFSQQERDLKLFVVEADVAEELPAGMEEQLDIFLHDHGNDDKFEMTD